MHGLSHPNRHSSDLPVEPQIEVSARVWGTILARRRSGSGNGISPAEWSAAEHAAYELHRPLLGPADISFVLAQVGQSLDGRVATPDGDCRDVSGPGGLAHLHRLRALSDAVIVGAKTVLSDDPRMNVRLVEGPNPACVVIDLNGRVPADAMIWRGERRRIVFQSVNCARPEGVEIVTIRPTEDGVLHPAEILAALAQRGLHRILVEGGASTIRSFLEAALVNRLHVSVAPKIIGSGPTGFSLPAISDLSQSIQPQTLVYGLGSDILFDCALSRSAG